MAADSRESNVEFPAAESPRSAQWFARRTTEADERAVDKLLAKLEIERERLTLSQIAVLREYCRNRRLARWSFVCMIPLLGLFVYTVGVALPQLIWQLYSSPPGGFLGLDGSDGSPDSKQASEIAIRTLMMTGAMAGATVVSGVYALLILASNWLGGWHRRALLEFLKVTMTEEE